MSQDPRRYINPPPQPPKQYKPTFHSQPPQQNYNSRPYDPQYHSSSQNFSYKPSIQDENDSYIPGRKFPSYSQQIQSPSFSDYSKKHDQKQFREPLTVKWTGTYNPEVFQHQEEVSRMKHRNAQYKQNTIMIDSDADSLSLDGSEDSIIFDNDEISITNRGPKYSQSVFQDDKIKKTNKNSMTEKSNKDDEAKQDQINLIAKLAAAKLSSTAKTATSSEGNKILNDFRARINAATPGPKLNSEDTTISTAPSTISKRASPSEDFQLSHNIDNSRPFALESRTFQQEKPSQPSQFLNNTHFKPGSDLRLSQPSNLNGIISNPISTQNKPPTQFPSNSFNSSNGQGSKQFNNFKPEMPSTGFDINSRPSIDQSSNKVSAQPNFSVKTEANGQKVELTLPNGMNIQDFLEQAKSKYLTQPTNNNPLANNNYQYSLNIPTQNSAPLPNIPINNGYNNMPRKKYSNYNEEDQSYRNKPQGQRDFSYERNRNFSNGNSYQRNDHRKNYQSRDTNRPPKPSLFIIKAEENSQSRSSLDYNKLLSTPINDFKHKNNSYHDFLERGNTHDRQRKEQKLPKPPEIPLLNTVSMNSPSDTGGKDSPLSSMYKNFLAKSKELFQSIEIGLATLEHKIDMDLQEQLTSSLVKSE